MSPKESQCKGLRTLKLQMHISYKMKLELCDCY